MFGGWTVEGRATLFSREERVAKAVLENYEKGWGTGDADLQEFKKEILAITAGYGAGRREVSRYKRHAALYVAFREAEEAVRDCPVCAGGGKRREEGRDERPKSVFVPAVQHRREVSMAYRPSQERLLILLEGDTLCDGLMANTFLADASMEQGGLGGQYRVIERGKVYEGEIGDIVLFKEGVPCALLFQDGGGAIAITFADGYRRFTRLTFEHSLEGCQCPSCIIGRAGGMGECQ